MGACSSCCTSNGSPERELLLPKSGPRNREEAIAQYTDKVADIAGALEAGRLPSQVQINRAFQSLLNSNLLNVETTNARVPPLLRKELVTIVNDIKEVVVAMLEFGEEKNADDKLQELFYASNRVSTKSTAVSVAVDAVGGPSSVPRELQEAVDHLPSVPETQDDIAELAEAVKNLTQLTIFSSTFRYILRDIFISTRAILAQTIAAVGEAASEIQIAANTIEPLVDPENNLSTTLDQQLSTVVEEATSNTAQAINLVGEEVMDQAKDIVINRIQEMIIRAHSSPRYKAALRTIFTLLQKYSERASEVASVAATDVSGGDKSGVRVEPWVWTDESLSVVLADLKVLLERAASGHSIDPLLQTLRTCVQDFVGSLANPDLTEYFADLKKWVDQSLTDPKYSASRAGRQMIDELHDRGRALFSEDTKFGQNFRLLVCLADDLLNKISQDHVTNRVVCAIDRFFADSAILFQEQPYQVGRELRRDLLFWLLPRFLRIVRSLPIPRVELISDAVEVALDSIILTSPTSLRSLMPDSIHVTNHNDLHITQCGDPHRENFVRLRVEGLRMAIQDLEYYFQYKGIIGYEDEGLISIYAGDEHGKGLNFEVDLEFDTDIDPTKVEYGFRVLKVDTAVSGLHFSIDESKHWIFNKLLLQPLAGPVVRKMFERVASGYIRDGLEAISRFVADVGRDAVEKAAPGVKPDFDEYWSALLKRLNSSNHHPSPHPGESREYAPKVVSHTEATLRGIIRTTETEHASNGDAGESEVTTMAIGVAPQILPGKAVIPANRTDKAVQEGRNVIEEVEGAVEQVKNTAEELVESVPTESQARTVYDHSRRRVDERRNAETVGKNLDGWRSDAFNL